MAGMNAMVTWSLSQKTVPPGVYQTVADFNERASTKEKWFIRILHHHMELENAQSNILSFDPEGEPADGMLKIDPDFTPQPPVHALESGRRTQFVIYSNFVVLMKYICSVSVGRARASISQFANVYSMFHPFAGTQGS